MTEQPEQKYPLGTCSFTVAGQRMRYEILEELTDDHNFHSGDTIKCRDIETGRVVEISLEGLGKTNE